MSQPARPRTHVRTLLSACAHLSALALLAACGGGDATKPPVPSRLEKTAGDGVTGQVAAATSAAPTVKVTDEGGRAVANVVVDFTVNGGGSIAVTKDTTGADGLATAGTWTLGTLAGQQTVVAMAPVVAGASATFTATAAPGAPARLVFITEPPASGQVGTPLGGQVVVEIRDSFGNRTSSTATVTLTIATNSGQQGTLAGTTSVAAVAGRATFENISASTIGTFTMQASSPGLLGTFSSNALTVASGPPASLAKVSGDVQLAGATGPAFLTPTVRVTDAGGNPVQGEPVTFSVVAGGGMVFGGSVLSDADGLARPSRWMLGPNAGANTLRATMRTVTADFAATAAAPSPFNMVLRYINVPTRRQQDAFEAAWLRWRSIITGDLSDLDFASQPLAGPCSGVNQTLNELVDDLIIYVNLAPIDGPGQVLGSAGPCRLRNSNLIPGVGVMTFDTADLPNLDAQGQLNNVILHEMGHVLGIGTIWGSQYKNLLNGGGTDSSSFDGVQAKGAWQSFGGLPAGSRVPVENCVGLTNCGAGTRDGHWRELVFRTELMTGYLNGGGPNPLSRLTILSLQDLGYQVDVSLADNYALPTSIEAGNGVRGAITSAGPLIPMIEAPLPEPIVVDARGRSLGPVSEWRRRQFR